MYILHHMTGFSPPVQMSPSQDELAFRILHVALLIRHLEQATLKRLPELFFIHSISPDIIPWCLS